MNRKTLSFIILILLVLTGCFHRPEEVKNIEKDRAFFNKYEYGSKELCKHFTELPIEEQYELYIYGNQLVHPPMIGLTECFVEQGPEVVPFLKEKLRTAQSEVTIRDIVNIFAGFAHKGNYNFSADKELVDLLDSRVEGMKGWKYIATDWMTEIHWRAGKGEDLHDFFRLPEVEQVRRFKELSLQEQYNIFMYKHHSVRLNDNSTYLAIVLAERGMEIIPILRKQLSGAEDDRTVNGIVKLFQEIARRRLYDFGKDQELLNIAVRKTASVFWNHKDVKEETLRMIEDLKSGVKD